MVTPTWCHRATWGNPFAGDCWPIWLPNLHFLYNLIIHLGKVKQLAFRLCTILRSPAGPVVPVIPGYCTPTTWSRLEHSETSFFTCSFRFWRTTRHECQAGTRPSGVVFFLFDGFWWGWTFCASNSMELEQLFMPLRHDLTTVPKGNNARPLG